MVSTALTDWRSTRADRLDRLFKAHAAVGGQGRGRRWETEELNHSILLRLASEFQGFCRDLHDDSGDVIAAYLTAGNSHLLKLLQTEFRWNRKLDFGNASPGAIGADFLRLGVRLWDGIYVRYPTKGHTWNQGLMVLNTARNCIAHDDSGKLANVHASGWTLTLASARRWRRLLDRMAGAMDNVCADHLQSLTGKTPW